MGGYMSWQEAEARSYTVASNPTSPGYGGGSYSTQRWNEQQRQREEEQRRQAQYQDNRPSGYVGGTFNPATGETTGGHPAEAQMAADRARTPANDAAFNAMRQGSTYDEYRRSRAVEEAQGRFRSVSDNPNAGTPFDRPDIYKPDDAAQLNLMRQGYTAEQSAEMLRVDAAKRQDYAAERKYETLRQQANATTVSEASAYHHAAKDSGLPQAPNPFEYAADLALYAEKGYPRKKSEAFSPVDPTVLNLQDGRGGQDYVWLSDSDRNYDLRGAMDTIAQAKRAGTMGAYGQLGSPSSSKYGTLSLADQQDIARYVNENPVHQAAGFRTNEGAMSFFTEDVRSKDRGAFVSSVSPTIQSQAQSGGNEDPFKNASVQEVYRPGDAALAVNNLYGAEKDQNIVNQFTGGIIKWITPGTMDKKYTGTPVQTPEGAPYEKDGVMYQDYKIMTPVKTESTYVPSGFEVGEQETAKRTTFWIPNYEPVNTGSPADYVENYMRGAVQGFKEKPNTAAINFGVGLGATALTMGVVNPAVEAGAVGAIASGSRWAIPAAATNVAVKFGVPAALGTMYTYDVYEQATLGGRDLSPAAATRAGYRGGYETLPMIAGAGTYGVMNAKLTPGYNAAIESGAAKGGVDYFVQKPVSRVVNRVTADYYQTKELMTTGTTDRYSSMGMHGSTPELDITGKAVPNQARADIMRSRVESSNAGSTPRQPLTMQLNKEIPGYAESRSTQPKITPGKINADDFGVLDYVKFKAGSAAARFTYEGQKVIPPEPSSVNPPKLTTEPGSYATDQFGRLLMNRKGEPVMRAVGGQEITNEPYFNALGEKAYPQPPAPKTMQEPMRYYAPELKQGEVTHGLRANAQGDLEVFSDRSGLQSVTNEKYFQTKAEGAYANDRFSLQNIAKAAGAGKSVSPEKQSLNIAGYTRGGELVTPEEVFLSAGERAYGKPRPIKEQTLEALIKIGGLEDKLAAKGWKGFGGEQAAPQIVKGQPPGAPATQAKYPRMTGTKIVGGVKTPSLTKEASLKGLDLTKSAGDLGGKGSSTKGSPRTNIGQSVDYRNQPRGGMKPFTKQAGQSAVAIMKEEVPILDTRAMTESAIRSNVAFQQARTKPIVMNIPSSSMGARSSSAMLVEPEQAFMTRQSIKQNNKSGMTIAPMLASRFGQQSMVRQSIAQVSGLDTRQRMKERAIGRETAPMRVVMPVRGILQGEGQKPRQDTITGLIPSTRQGTLPLSRQATDQIQRQRTTQDQSYLFRQEQLYTTERMPKGIAMPIPFALPGIGYGSGQGSLKVRSGRKHTELFSTAFGTLSATMFSRSGFGADEGAPRKKAVYGNYRGQFTTARGKTIRVKPMPKRMYET